MTGERFAYTNRHLKSSEEPAAEVKQEKQ